MTLSRHKEVWLALSVLEMHCILGDSSSAEPSGEGGAVVVSAGSSADVAICSVAQVMVSHLGRPMVIENRLLGAGGVVGAIAWAPADGYTLGLITTNPVVNPAVIQGIPYETR